MKLQITALYVALGCGGWALAYPHNANAETIIPACASDTPTLCVRQNERTPFSAKILLRESRSVKITADPRIKSFVAPGYVGVWGLKEGENVIRIETIADTGKSESFDAKVMVKIPDDLKDIHIKGGPGRNIAFNHKNHVIVLNGADNSIFWSADVGLTHNFEQVPTGFLVQPNETGLVVQVSWWGDFSEVLDFGPKFKTHHDLATQDGGSFFVLATDTTASTIEDRVIEVGPSMKWIRIVDLSKILDRRREVISDMKHLAEKDWLHLNSIEYYPEKQEVLLSSRNQSAVISLSSVDWSIRWIFADPKGWSPNFQQFIVRPTEPMVWPSGQHDAKLIAGKLYLFDNQATSEMDGRPTPAEEISSTVRSFELDEVHKTIREVPILPKHPKIFSKIKGGLDVDDSLGRTLVCYCGIMKDRSGSLLLTIPKPDEYELSWVIKEFDSRTGDLVRSLEGEGFGYRAKYLH